jgi:RNA polymerase sigma-70 factor (ECF subfamily)
MDDDELITRLAGGDDTALRELFARHAPMLAARLRAVLPPSDVEDVLQETFLAAWKGAGSYRAEERAGGWLWGIARRQAALLLRRRGPATATLPDLLEPGPAGLAGSGFAGDPAQLLTTASELASAVGLLSPADREVWQLMYVEDRPVAEVATMTGVPEGTVKSRAHRGQRQLLLGDRARPARHGRARRGRGRGRRRHLRLADSDDRGLRAHARGRGHRPVGQAGVGLIHGMLPVERNLLGFTGVALLLSLAIGGLLSWIGPLAYVGICQCAAIANYSEPLTWAARPPADRGGWVAALVVFAVGLIAFTIRGPRIRPSGE